MDIADKLFLAGYASGSSVGFAQTLGMYFCTQCKKLPWDVPQIVAWLQSLCRIKVTFAVYADAFERASDGLGPWLSKHDTHRWQYLRNVSN